MGIAMKYNMKLPADNEFLYEGLSNYKMLRENTF
jgi:hypothetical protein